MTKRKERPVGKTKDVGFQVGVRRTVPIDYREAWQLVTSGDGLQAWLGDAPPLAFEEGETYELGDGATGEIRVFAPESHVRLTWQPGDWPRPSTIQVRVIDKGDRSVIAFHQEHLPDTDARENRKAHFKDALEALKAMI